MQSESEYLNDFISEETENENQKVSWIIVSYINNKAYPFGFD